MATTRKATLRQTADGSTMAAVRVTDDVTHTVSYEHLERLSNAAADRLRDRVDYLIDRQHWNLETGELADALPSSMGAAYADLIESISGRGSRDHQLTQFFTGLDQYGKIPLQPNLKHTGYTFITRPCLCLTSTNLRADSTFAPLDTIDPSKMGFGLRCYLDPRWAIRSAMSLAERAVYYQPNTPFFIPLCRALTGLSGAPGPYIDTYTTPPGFFGEDQTSPVGSNRSQASYDLTLTFNDIPNSPIGFALMLWIYWMDHACRGTMRPYSEFEEDNVMCYTCSIYRFALDPTRRYITDFYKATGCFPKSVPLEEGMNVNEGEVFTTAGVSLSVPFTANKVEINKPDIIADFNRLVARYAPGIASAPILPRDPANNFTGTPFIVPEERGLRFTWRDYTKV